MITRYSTILVTLCLMTAAEGLVASAAAQQSPASAAGSWVVPRTPDGHPDFQGTWTNVTITPFERPEDQESPVLSWEEVQERQGDAVDPTDPDRPAPQPGEVSRCSSPPTIQSLPAGFQEATTTGRGYNDVYCDWGANIAIVNGEFRSSLLTNPSDGRRPALTPEGERRVAADRATREPFEQYDHPELRPLSERCLLSRDVAGPPMIAPRVAPDRSHLVFSPFERGITAYNSNYTIVQTADHILIMAEMVHDARIIRIGDGPRLPPHIRPWMGDSWGRWEGDALVVETTNFHPLQTFLGIPPSEHLKVTERFTRVDEETILYEFTVDDPTTYSSPWGGEIPFKPLNDRLYEYACHEGNYNMAGVLGGARYQERMEAQEKSGSR